MENQTLSDSFFRGISPEGRDGENQEGRIQIQWEADFFQITPEGMEVVQKRGAESLTL